MNKKLQRLQSLPCEEHLQNIIKILKFDFWSDDERLFYIQVYVKMAVEKTHWDNRPYEDKHMEKLLGILNE